jgi:hypothetical protein
MLRTARDAGSGDELGNDDLAVAGLETSHQDLVCTGIERAAAPASRTTAAATRKVATCPATVASSPASTGAFTSPSTSKTASSPTQICHTAGQDRKWLAASCAVYRILAGAKETATTSASATAIEGTTAIASGAPEDQAHAPAVRAREAVTAGNRGTHSEPRTTSSAGDDQRRISKTDHKATAAACTTEGATKRYRYRCSCTADGDLQCLARCQDEVPADLDTTSAQTDLGWRRWRYDLGSNIPALRPKRKDLIGAGGRHREWDKASGVIENDRIGMGSRLRCGQGQECRPSEQKLFHSLPFLCLLNSGL